MDTLLKLHRMWLSNQNGENFTGTDLSRLVAEGVCFHDSRFYDADLSSSDFREAEFYHARLHHSSLLKMKARNANFVGARLDHCDFTGAGAFKKRPRTSFG